MPIFILDTDGTLVFYNEPAELILDHRFDETGEMSAESWMTLFALTDHDRKPIPIEKRPTMLVLSGRKPISRKVWMRVRPREWRHVQITAFPLIGESNQFLGAQMIFWEI